MLHEAVQEQVTLQRSQLLGLKQLPDVARRHCPLQERLVCDAFLLLHGLGGLDHVDPLSLDPRTNAQP